MCFCSGLDVIALPIFGRDCDRPILRMGVVGSRLNAIASPVGWPTLSLTLKVIIIIKDTGSTFMIEMHKILKLSQQIAEVFDPERIILFGSYAYGTPTEDSDVDLLVVLPFEGQAFRKAAEILNSVDPKFSVDLLVRTADEVQQRLELGDFFLREIVEQGKVLYEAAYAGVG
jgi:uncharacterized protein